jgi:hypothetical protein
LVVALVDNQVQIPKDQLDLVEVVVVLDNHSAVALDLEHRDKDMLAVLLEIHLRVVVEEQDKLVLVDHLVVLVVLVLRRQSMAHLLQEVVEVEVDDM